MVEPLKKRPETRGTVLDAVRVEGPRFTSCATDVVDSRDNTVSIEEAPDASEQMAMFPEEQIVRDIVTSGVESVKQKERIVVATEADIPQIVELYQSRSVHDGNPGGIKDFETYGGMFFIPTAEDLRKDFRCPEYKMYVLKREIDGVERVLALVDFVYPPSDQHDPKNNSSIYFDTIHGPPYEEVRGNMRGMNVDKKNIFWIHDYLRARKSDGGRSSDVMKLLSYAAFKELDLSSLDDTGIVSEIIVGYSGQEEELTLNAVSTNFSKKLGFTQVGIIRGELGGCKVLKHVCYISAKNLASKMLEELSSSS
ncbi:hypothetical protein ACFL3C_00925 [Patescibacteria group bacterium]